MDGVAVMVPMQFSADVGPIGVVLFSTVVEYDSHQAVEVLVFVMYTYSGLSRDECEVSICLMRTILTCEYREYLGL